MTEKYEKEQERFRREERLILSAMYEVSRVPLPLLLPSDPISLADGCPNHGEEY
jgi:hypothetical protein